MQKQISCSTTQRCSNASKTRRKLIVNYYYLGFWAVSSWKSLLHGKPWIDERRCSRIVINKIELEQSYKSCLNNYWTRRVTSNGRREWKCESISIATGTPPYIESKPKLTVVDPRLHNDKEIYYNNEIKIPVRIGPLFFPIKVAYPSEDRQTDLETSQAPLDDDSWNKRQKYNTLSVSLLERNLEFGNVVLTFESVG